MNYKYFTSESVCAGHPDKICDQVSDACLDACLKQDKHTHAGIECLATSNRFIASGEVKTNAKVNYEKIVRGVIKELGYDKRICPMAEESCKRVLSLPVHPSVHQEDIQYIIDACMQ